MRVRASGLVLAACLACLGFSGPALAQSYSLPGVLNLRTGLFQARPLISPLASTTTYSGIFDVTITVTIASSIPTRKAVVCTANISATDSTYAPHNESSSVAGVRSGSTATCTLTIPYSWSLGSTPTYSFGYAVSSAATAGVPARESDYYPSGVATVPAKGTTTKLTAAVTL